MQPIILVGAGGHCRSCIDVIEQTNQYKIAGIVGQAEEQGTAILGYPIELSDDDLPRLAGEGGNFLITIGQIKTNQPRVRLFNLIQASGGQLPAIISPLAYVSKHAQIAAGSIVMHHSIVNAGVQVGLNCIINSKSLIEHDTAIGDHCHISTGAIINGGTTVGDHCFIGSGAVTRHAIQIPAGSLIGAASWVDQNSVTRIDRK